MGQFNPILGSMRGKYGGSVLYRYNGKQCIRERVIRVSNPKSSKQAIQRAILATCGRFVSAFAPILNNSIQAESSKVKSLAKIRSLNMDYLRGLAAAGDGQFNPKSLLSIMPNDYIVSRGSLVGINPLRSAAARSLLATDGELQFAASSLVINATVTASQAFPTVAVGDQITLLAVTNSDDDGAPMVGYCRFAFKNDLTPVFVVGSGTNYSINPEAVDTTRAAGNWADVVFMSDDNAIYMPPVIGDYVGDPIDLAAVIVSRESERLRSNSSAVASSRVTIYPLDVAYPTYMEGGSGIDMPSEVYLNNDSQGTSSVVRYSGYAMGSSPELPFTFTGVEDRLVVLSSQTTVPEGTTSLGLIKCSLNGVDYETTIEVTSIGSSVEANAGIEGVGEEITLSGLNAQGPQLTLSIGNIALAGLIITSIDLTW